MTLLIQFKVLDCFLPDCQCLGIILSGNEISQILLSLILTYYGGNRNRPRWISWGVIFCALSCFVLASPHFIYGPGEEALKLTKEYLNDRNGFTISVSFMILSNDLCIRLKNISSYILE